MLRRKNGVVQRNGRAGALRIEFIERSRNESLGIEWFFAADGAECGGRTGTLEGGVSGFQRENDWRRRVAGELSAAYAIDRRQRSAEAPDQNR